MLIFDLETTGLDSSKDKILLFGYYSYLLNKFDVIEYNDSNINEIRKLIAQHDWFVTYNGNNFDNNFLVNNKLIKATVNERSFIKYYNKLDGERFNSIDLLDVLKKRETVIKPNGFNNLSLNNVVQELKISDGKSEGFKIVSSLNELTVDELIQFKNYCLNDIVITKKLLEYLDNLFFPMTRFMTEYDNNSFKYLTTSPGSMCYSIVCNLAQLTPIFSEHVKSDEDDYEGGFVSCDVESERGKIYCLDFSSAYPHAFMMANLFSYKCSCCSDNEKYTGNGFFKLSGKYCTKQLGKIESVIKDLYQLRKQNKGTTLEYSLKIILNTIYGITGNPAFAHFYNKNTASDCTLIVREMIKYAREEFKKSGYKILYSDTDSIYLTDTFLDENKLINKKAEIISFLKTKFIFAQDTFNMGIDARIKYIQFFKDYDNVLLKKNYIYLTEENKIKIKGLPIVKKNCSELSKHIFKKHIESKIFEKMQCKFSRDKLYELIVNELQNNVKLAVKKYSIANNYDSKTSIQNQILQKYGPGKIDIITLNTSQDIGVGKNKKYISLDEFNKLNLNIKLIDTDTFLSELSYFIKNDRTTLDMYNACISNTLDKNLKGGLK
jgi:DNA polymerase elongation subunit (family B)